MLCTLHNVIRRNHCFLLFITYYLSRYYVIKYPHIINKDENQVYIRNRRWNVIRIYVAMCGRGVRKMAGRHTHDWGEGGRGEGATRGCHNGG